MKEVENVFSILKVILGYLKNEIFRLSYTKWTEVFDIYPFLIFKNIDCPNCIKHLLITCVKLCEM